MSFQFLKEDLNLQEDVFVAPLEVTSEDLLLVHSRSYLDSLKVIIYTLLPLLVHS